MAQYSRYFAVNGFWLDFLLQNFRWMLIDFNWLRIIVDYCALCCWGLYPVISTNCKKGIIASFNLIAQFNLDTMFKFLVLNPSEKSDEIVKKANIQHKKNGFELIILLESFQGGSIKPDAPMYYPNKGEETSTDNIFGVKGVIELKCGITIAFTDDEDLDYSGKIDILVLSRWPSKIYNKVNETVNVDFSIDKIVSKYTPRYIFSKGDVYEYGPFEWDNGVVGRFISLKPEGEGKWFYAFNFPLIPTEISRNEMVENPFSKEASLKKRELDDDSQAKSISKKQKVTPQECFFCLSNPNVETHMIVTIGQSIYMTVAKGPLTRANTNMPFSGHGIMIPIEHTSKSNEVIEKEMQEFEHKLYKIFAADYPDLVLIAFDLNLDKNVHYHRQFVPIHKRFLPEGSFRSVLDEKAQINNEKYQKNHKLDFQLVESIDPAKQYISFKVYENETPTIYQSIIEEPTKIIDLQFPRRVLTYIIRSPKRLYWDKCQQPTYKEAHDCEEFKKFFN